MIVLSIYDEEGIDEGAVRGFCRFGYSLTARVVTAFGYVAKAVQEAQLGQNVVNAAFSRSASP